MEYLLKSNEMKRCDSYTSEHFKVPSICLMERAALAAFEEIKLRFTKNDHILVICGSGNNGGDGLAIARMLYLDDYDVEIAFVGNKEKATDSTLIQLEIISEYGIKYTSDIHNIDYKSYTCIIDAIFGIGINRCIEGKYYDIIAGINESNAKTVSIDVPSGINSDNGNIMGIAVKAAFTVTFAFYKAGLFLFPAASYAGEIILKEIGITGHSLVNKPQLYTYNEEDLPTLLPKRYRDSNKGSYGKVTLFAGTKNMAGAAYLAAISAYRSGAGLVRIVTIEENRTILQSLIPEAVLITYEYDNPNEDTFKQIIESSSAIGCGCGLGTDSNAKKVLVLVLKYARVPCVFDADALNIFASTGFFNNNNICNNTDIIITPHLGEMSRLCNREIAEIKNNLIDTAIEFAENNSLCCVLKDTRTVVAAPGSPVYLNIHGTNGMATGGSGDSLCGIICGLLAQKMSTKDAACTGVLIHSLAGEAAQKKLGDISMTSRNITEEISTILRRFC